MIAVLNDNNTDLPGHVTSNKLDNAASNNDDANARSVHSFRIDPFATSIATVPATLLCHCVRLIIHRHRDLHH
jgi:hypothetical protein